MSTTVIVSAGGCRRSGPGVLGLLAGLALAACATTDRPPDAAPFGGLAVPAAEPTAAVEHGPADAGDHRAEASSVLRDLERAQQDYPGEGMGDGRGARVFASLGLGAYEFAGREEFAPALRFGGDVDVQDRLGAGAEFLIAGTPADVDDFDAGGFIVRLFPFVRYVIAESEDFYVAGRGGPELAAAGVGDDFYAELIAGGARFGVEGTYFFTAQHAPEWAAFFEVDLGVLGGETEVGVNGFRTEEGDVFFTYDIELGGRYRFDWGFVQFGYMASFLESDELDDAGADGSVGWQGAMFGVGGDF